MEAKIGESIEWLGRTYVTIEDADNSRCIMCDMKHPQYAGSEEIFCSGYVGNPCDACARRDKKNVIYRLINKE